MVNKAQAKRATEDLAEAEKQSRIAKAERAVALKEKQEAERAKTDAELKNRQAINSCMRANINLAQQAYGSSNTQRVQDLLIEAPNTSGDPRGFEWRYLQHLLESEKSSRRTPSKGTSHHHYLT